MRIEESARKNGLIKWPRTNDLDEVGGLGSANSMNCAVNTNPRRAPLMLLKRATVRNVSRALKEINVFEVEGDSLG